MKNQIIHYIRESLLTCLAVLLVLSLVQPFDIDKITEGRIGFILGETGLVFVACMISYVLLAAIPAYRRWTPKNIVESILHGLPFYLVMTPILSVFIVSYNFWHNGTPIEYVWLDENGMFTLKHIGVMCGWVSVIGFFIMIWQTYRFHASQLQQELENVRAINALLEERQQQLTEVADTEDEREETRVKCTLTGNAQNARLEVCPEDIIYIESMANYADVVYIEDGETRHRTLRITLKQLREELDGTEWLVQCHRAFIVNLNFVVSLSVRSAGTYDLQLFGMEKRIPVSRANADTMKQRLEKK